MTNMDTAKVIQVIETTMTRRGTGKDEASPIRVVTQYWSLEGKLLAEVDPTQYTGSNCGGLHKHVSDWAACQVCQDYHYLRRYLRTP